MSSLSPPCSSFCLFIESQSAAYIGLICCIIVCIILIYTLYIHLINYNVPKLQRYAIRVICIIPVYCINSFFAVYFQKYSFYFDVLKEVYEGFVVYNFLYLCLASVGYDSDLVDWWNRQNNPQLPSSWFYSTCCIEIHMNAPFLRYCKQGVLQFVIIKIMMAIVIFICSAYDNYAIGSLNSKNAYIYIFIIYNFSYTIALYSLLLFYLSAKELLTPFKPVMKFVMVKSIIFVTFWQTIILSISFSSFGHTSNCSLNESEFQGRFHNFLLVCECVPAVVLNMIYFTPADFHGELPALFVLPKTDIIKSLSHLLSVYDVYLDILHAFGWNYSSYTLNRSETAADVIHSFAPKSDDFDPEHLDQKEQIRLDVEMEENDREELDDAISEANGYKAYDMGPIEIKSSKNQNSFDLFTGNK